MNAAAVHTIVLVLIAYLATFLAAVDQPFNRILDTQINLLPALMVYTGLSAGWATLTALAVLAGLWFDALSANPLGISILPLFIVAFALKWSRELILRDAPYAQFVLGGLASAIVPILSLISLFCLGYKPVLGWNSFPQFLLKIIIGAAATPLFFWLLARLHRALIHPQMGETSFRNDREIKRGRA